MGKNLFLDFFQQMFAILSYKITQITSTGAYFKKLSNFTVSEAQIYQYLTIFC